MQLIVGLGNSGKEYELTPHNLGFILVDYLDELLRNEKIPCESDSCCQGKGVKCEALTSSERDRVKSKRFEAVEFEVDFETEEWECHTHLGILKPLVFMNKSGEVVREVVRSLEAKGFDIGTDLLVVHDDLDLPFGELRLQRDRGSAGHNGVQSIIEALKSQEFSRLRVGIGRSKVGAEPVDYVLSRLSKDEQEALEGVKKVASKKIKQWLLALQGWTLRG